MNLLMGTKIKWHAAITIKPTQDVAWCDETHPSRARQKSTHKRVSWKDAETNFHWLPFIWTRVRNSSSNIYIGIYNLRSLFIGIVEKANYIDANAIC